MNDTVKLIIEIPIEAKQAFDKAQSNDLKGGYYDHGGIIGKAIQNGIPLDDVKAEIRKLKYFPATSEYELDYNAGLIATIDILDNIGKESEGTNEHSTNLCISNNTVL